MNTRVPLDSSPEWWAIVNTLGQSALIETLRMAAYYVTHSNGIQTKSHMFTIEIKEARSCYFYIQGTGLNMLLEKFNLDYDPDRIRESFNYCVRKSA